MEALPYILFCVVGALLGFFLSARTNALISIIALTFAITLYLVPQGLLELFASAFLLIFTLVGVCVQWGAYVVGKFWRKEW